MSHNNDHHEAREIILAKRKWAIPLLAAKQNKIIDPLILSLLPVFIQCQKDQVSILTVFNQVHYDALLEIAYVAVSRAHSDLTREQFLELPVTLPELIAAFSIIAQQTGVFAKGEPGEA